MDIYNDICCEGHQAGYDAEPKSQAERMSMHHTQWWIGRNAFYEDRKETSFSSWSHGCFSDCDRGCCEQMDREPEKFRYRFRKFGF